MSVDTKWHETRGGGQVAERMRSMDWSGTSLGPIERWPLALRISVSNLLATAIPMAVAWGERYLLFYNDAYLSLLQDKHPQALGRPLEEVWPDQWPLLGPGLARVLEKGETIAFHDRALHTQSADGPSTRWFTGSWSPICDESGRPCGVLTALYETTARVLAEADHRRVVQALQAADRQKDEFITMLGHELRNPLAPIVNALQLIGHDESLGERSRRALGIAQRQARQLGRLVDDLLEVSRITQGKIRLKFESIDVGELVRSMVESLRPGFELRRQRLIVTIAPAAVRIVADPVRVTQVLQNLLDNAGKYTGEAGEIGIACAADGDGAIIEVWDNGAGISAQALPRIFELFTQGDRSYSGPQGGLGIGLALVKRLVELHGGSVSAHSDGPGRGARFTVRLPGRPVARAGPEEAI